MKEDIGICNRKKITDFQGIHILKTYGWVRGFKTLKYLVMLTVGRVGGSVISMLTDAYVVCGWVGL